MRLSLDEIRTDGGTQPRESINREVVDDYIDAKQNGAKFPPVTVFHDGEAYWLADGFHRVAAARKFGAKKIEADVTQGTRREAVLHSVGANADHGLRRTNADKRRAVMALLNDDEWSGWSDNEIAQRCSVSQPFVSKLRESITSNVISEKPTERTYTTKHGTTATMNTGNIGKREPAAHVTRDEPLVSEWTDPEIDDDSEDDEEDAPETEAADTPAEIIAGMVQRYYESLVSDEKDATAHEVANSLLKYFRNLSAEYNRRT